MAAQPTAGGYRSMAGPGQKFALTRSSEVGKAAQKGKMLVKASQKPLLRASMKECEEKSEGGKRRMSRALSRRRRHKTLL